MTIGFLVAAMYLRGILVGVDVEAAAGWLRDRVEPRCRVLLGGMAGIAKTPAVHPQHVRRSGVNLDF